eukprot:m.124013 g.124013  ORF g.124013 m.124013 type:complete len:548 (-) comp14462_c0_seq1:2014-3657(-)
MSDDEEIGGLEKEMARLHRQQRLSKVQRKTLTDSIENEKRKQEVQLSKLEKDNIMLKEQLRLAQLDADAELSTGNQVRELKAQYEGYAAEIDAEKERVAELQKEINATESELTKDMNKLGKAQGQVRTQESINKQMQTLENRVQHATNAYNTQLTENAKLRQTIDHLKKERGVYGGLKKRLVKELNDLKRQMGELVEQSNRAYEARDDAEARMTLLKERSQKETQEATMELKELNRTLESERKLKEFMGVKGQDRAKELEAAIKARREKGTAREKPEDTIMQYEAVFEEIKRTSGIADTSLLVDKFIETEDRNFSLFNLVNELNGNIEKLKEQIHRVQTDIALYNTQNERMDKERRETLSKLESKLVETETEAMKLKEKVEEKDEEVEKLTKGVSELFSQIGCDEGPIVQMLGDKNVNERNIMQFLGIVEQRANELLLMQANLDFKAQKKWEADADKLINEKSAEEAVYFDPTATLGTKPKPNSVLGTGPKLGTQLDETMESIPLHPSIDDDDDEDDEGDLRPLTHEELRTKLISRIKTRDGSKTAA